MTYEESKQYRWLQRIGVVTAGGFSLLSAYMHSSTDSWVIPAIFCILISVVVAYNYRAAKMEVLSVLGISLPVYENVLAKEQRRGRR